MIFRQTDGAFLLAGMLEKMRRLCFSRDKITENAAYFRIAFDAAFISFAYARICIYNTATHDMPYLLLRPVLISILLYMLRLILAPRE